MLRFTQGLKYSEGPGEKTEDQGHPLALFSPYTRETTVSHYTHTHTQVFIHFRNHNFLNMTMPTVPSVNISTFQVQESGQRALDLVGARGEDRRIRRKESRVATFNFPHPMITRLSRRHRHQWPSKTLLLPGKQILCEYSIWEFT